MAHAYVTFRIRLAQHALRSFAASLRGSAQITLLVFTHALVGLLALAALPPMFATSLALLPGSALLAAHALAMTLPLALLRHRVLPDSVVQWSHRLPLAPALRLRANALVAGLLAGPLALVYLISGTVLVLQSPPWLQRLPAIGATLLSLGLTWLLSTALLERRSRLLAAAVRAGAPAQPQPYTARPLRPRTLALWQRLFWQPFWRCENLVGRQQSVLLAAALASAVPWMMAPAGVTRALLALSTSALLVLVTDRGDKAVREQAAALRPLMAAWPLDPAALLVLARAFAVLPALLVVLVVFAGGLPHGLWQHNAGRAWLALGVAGPALIAGLPFVNERTRAGLVIALILILTATGSELWP